MITTPDALTRHLFLFREGRAMNAKQVMGRLDTIKAKIECLLHEETTNRAFLVAVMGDLLWRDLRLVAWRIEALLNDETEGER